MSDLTTEEQARVRTALKFLRARCGGWAPLSKALGYGPVRAKQASCGRPVSARLAFRVARFAGVSVDDVLSGRYPDPNACPYCGCVAVQPAIR